MSRRIKGLVEFEDDRGAVVRLLRHPHGGGLVSRGSPRSRGGVGWRRPRTSRRVRSSTTEPGSDRAAGSTWTSSWRARER